MKKTLFTLILAMGLVGCDFIGLDDEPDPNGPSLEDISTNPTRDKVANLAVGVEASSRDELNTYLVDVSMIGREAWRFSAADPRFTGDLLGRGTSVLDDNTFYITRPWGARYRTVRNANILLDAVDGVVNMTDAEKQATKGYAKTMIAYQLLQNLNLTYTNGIRVDVAGDEPGPVLGNAEALAAISAMLADAAADLGAGGSSFPFPLSEGFADFNTPPTFRQFNRALAARVAVYRSNWQDALSLLPETFLDPAAPLTEGVYHTFSQQPGDLVNNFFFNPDAPAGDALVAHPSFMEDIDPADERSAKVVQRTEPATLDGLTSEWGFFVYKSTTAPIPIIRNAELLLIRAEARLQTGNLDGAVQDLNIVRNTAGLDDYAGAVTPGALLDEMLEQRRFELYGEGHRWVDLRRYGRLGELPLDRAEDDVWQQFPIPSTENV